MKVYNTNLVSIIIPVHNINFYLFEKCINSCIVQTYKDIEILIIANGINDKLYRQILFFQKLDNRIKIIRCSIKGVSKARNEGIKISKGNYICFVDADDYIEKEYVEKLLIPESDIVVCSFCYEYSYGTKKNIITNKQLTKTKDEFIKDLLAFTNSMGSVCGKMFNAKYLKEHNLLFDENLIFCEDIDFCLRAINDNTQIIYIPNIFYHYNIFSNVSSVRKFSEFYFKNYEKSLKKVENLIDKTKYLKEWSNFVIYQLFLICVNYCFNLSNKKSYAEKKQTLKDILEKDLFKKSIKLCNLKTFPLTKKITLFCLRYKMYFFVYIISIIRNKTR